MITVDDSCLMRAPPKPMHRVGLQTLKDGDLRDQKRCLHLWDDFEFNGHLCMVFDVLGTSLYDFMAKNSFRPFPIEEVQHFALQLAVAIEYMHSNRLTHTDLKPENIMVDSSQMLKVRTFSNPKSFEPTFLQADLCLVPRYRQPKA
jgi:serine/threonine protein kinase